MNKKINEPLNDPKDYHFWGSLQFKLSVYYGIVMIVLFYTALVILSYLVRKESNLSAQSLELVDFILSQVAIYGSLAIIIASVIFIVYIRRQVGRPISKIKERADKLADGVYDTPDSLYFFNNELNILSDTITELGFKIKDVSASTQAQRQRLDSVLTHMSDGVIATDRRGNIILANDAALLLLNKHREDLLQQSIMDAFEIREKYNFRQLLETDDELILNSFSDGLKTIIRVEFSVIKRQSGFISGIVCVLSDITEQEKIEQERREFVSNVSHELRTPLTSMRSYTEALIDGAWQDEDLAPNFLSVIQSETDRMIRMVTDLLNLSKLEDGNIQFDTELVDLTELVQRVCDRYDILLQSVQYKDKGYTLERVIARQSVWIEADEDKLIQVIDNILNNAIKYSPDGGNIKTQLVETETHVVFSVSDQGLGIPLKALSNVFKRFYRVDKARSREQGGTGLGLAIAKEVVELHKGKIWVTSRENQGSTFFVSLPKVDLADEWEKEESDNA
ncbi:PAS domain-containing protein [Carnobacteriaceae bacterium zg-ZUI240]|nr:PAS domain-containing protein [Carnobacteriaceae bacterium zg-ZUI240]